MQVCMNEEIKVHVVLSRGPTSNLRHVTQVKVMTMWAWREIKRQQRLDCHGLCYLVYQSSTGIMKVATAIVCAAVLFGLSEAFSLRSVFGPCIEACFTLQADGEVGSCPVGYECRSNGCGHTCQKVLTAHVECPLLKCLDIECPLGYATDENGCQTCSCRTLV